MTIVVFIQSADLLLKIYGTCMVKYFNKLGYTGKVVTLLLCIVSSVHSWKSEQCFGQFCSNTFSMLSFILKGVVVVVSSLTVV